MKPSPVYGHPNNLETCETGIRFHLQSAARDRYLATVREGDRREWAERCAVGAMQLAAGVAEHAAMLQGLRFSVIAPHTVGRAA